MNEISGALLSKFLLKYKSIPFAVLLCATPVFLSLPYDGTGLSTKFGVSLSISFLSLLVYICFTINANILPSVPKGKIGVLFIITCENKKTFEHVKYCLVDKFKELTQRFVLPDIYIICIDAKSIPKFDISRHKDYAKLLLRTKCLFAVKTRYTVDDTENAEHFEMEINYSLLHPMLRPEVKELLQREMNTFAIGVAQQQFKKEDCLQTFNITAQKLSYLCEYFLGVLFILNQDYSVARNIFINLHNYVAQDRGSFASSFLATVNIRIAETGFVLAKLEHVKYRLSHDKAYMLRYREIIEETNKYVKDTYGYFLDCAMLAIVLERDSAQAAKYVEKCKLLNERSDWRYSDAFLAAYDDMNPLKVYRKYQVAFRSEFNPLYIIEFIENALDEEPKRGSLHLALILIYNEINDTVLLHKHIAMYRNWIVGRYIGHGIIDIINRIEIEKPCINERQCNKNCIECSKATE